MTEYYNARVPVGDLMHKTLIGIEIGKDKDTVRFITTDGDVYWMAHEQDCCEKVRVEDVIGNLDDLIGQPLLMAEEVTSGDDPEDYERPPRHPMDDDSVTWTFYKFATVKGYVTIRWLGESNGYYSERVDVIYGGKV